MGDDVLRKIAQELVAQVRRNATVDWSVRESARARMRLTVKKLLRKYKYRPISRRKRRRRCSSRRSCWGKTGRLNEDPGSGDRLADETVVASTLGHA
jgi:hypothetical protein